jgi:hypothetical protein
MPFDQFEFHLGNMYFKGVGVFGNHNVLVCSAMWRHLLVLTVKASVAAVDLESSSNAL